MEPLMSSVSFSYDVPVALDSPPSTTDRLDPSSLRFRNLNNAASLKTRTLGPMPLQEFMDYYLPKRYTGDLSQLLSSRHAFKSVPTRAESVPTTCGALVSPLLYIPSHFNDLWPGSGIEPTHQI